MEAGEVIFMYSLLSSPLEFTGNLDKDIEIAYRYFQHEINYRQKRPTLFGKNIFIEARQNIEERPESFWHIITLGEKHKFDLDRVLPCVNDKNINLCNQNCSFAHRSVILKNERRNICLLRASRLPWIVDIIRLANNNDPLINVWLKPQKGKLSPKLYLRYNNNGIDYVLIFSVEKHYYRMISAYPVFYTKEKIKFSKEYQKFRWSYFQK